MDIDGISGSKDPVLSKRYLHGSGLDKILAQEDATGEVLWYLSDNSGTIRDIVSNDGAVVNHLVYDSFGNVIAQTNPLLKTRYLFTGREYESEVGLYYYRARYYDSSLGRFISEDPIGFNSGDTNLYTYVLNNPVYYVDPLGTVPRFVGTLLPNTFERLITYVKPNDFVNYTVAFTDNNALTPATFLPSQGASRIIGDNLKASLRYTPGNATTRYPGENLILGIQRGLRRLDDKGHIVPFLVGGNIFNQNGTLNTANFFWQNKFLNMGSYNQYGIRIADAFEANVTTDPATILTYRAELFYNYGSGQFYWDPNNPFRPGAFAAEPTDNRRRPYEAIELTNPISA